MAGLPECFDRTISAFSRNSSSSMGLDDPVLIALRLITNKAHELFL